MGSITLVFASEFGSFGISEFFGLGKAFFFVFSKKLGIVKMAKR